MRKTARIFRYSKAVSYPFYERKNTIVVFLALSKNLNFLSVASCQSNSMIH